MQTISWWADDYFQSEKEQKVIKSTESYGKDSSLMYASVIDFD